jgi:DNA polymerase zeta
MVADPNDEPQYGERIPYVITRGDSGTLLAERAFDPLEVVNNPYVSNLFILSVVTC